MITPAQQKLIDEAKADRAKNPQSRPTFEQLRAIDALLIDQAQSRAGAPVPPVLK